MRNSYLIGILLVVVAGCTVRQNRPDPLAAKNSLEQAISNLSLKQLDQAELVFRVAFNKSLESWQGGTDDVVAGCKITGKEAERGLAALRPWMDRALVVESKRLLDSPKNYKIPIDEATCENDCSCGLGQKILDTAKIDEISLSKVKDLRLLRGRLESKTELLTSERAEICSEAVDWICHSEFLKALKLAK